MTSELGKIVRPQSPTKACCIDPQDKSHIGLILSETKVTDKSGEVFLNMRTNEIVCALSSKTVYLSNNGQVISNIDLPYYWCNFCTFKTDEKQHLLSHLMEHRFSCHFCMFQTFSRVDVVRHTVQEHKQFDGADLKFCILLPDLLKHGSQQGEEHPTEKPASEKEDAKQSKRKRKNSLSEEEEEEESNKRSQAAAKGGRTRSGAVARRGRGFGAQRFSKSPLASEAVPTNSSSSSSSEEDNPPVTRRSTRATSKAEATTTRDKTPGVCFECSVCSFRTFKKAILVTHTEQKHKGAKARFALKIVSQSQAKEIEEKDGQIKRTEKSSPKPASNSSEAADEASKMEEEADTNTPEVEIDYADDSDYNDMDDNNDDDNDEDFVPSTEKKKRTTEKKILGAVNSPDPPMLKIEHVVSEQVSFRCLLCNKYTDNNLHSMKHHYIQTHPGGTLVWSQSTADGIKDQWMYFCLTDDCTFISANPLSWLEHCKKCQKNALEFPDPSNMLHCSISNTANTVKDNMDLIRQAHPTEGEGNLETQATTWGQVGMHVEGGDQSAVRIKTELTLRDSDMMYRVYNTDANPVTDVPVSSNNRSSPSKAFPVALMPNVAVTPVTMVAPKVSMVMHKSSAIQTRLEEHVGSSPGLVSAPAGAARVQATPAVNGPRMSLANQSPSSSNALVNMMMINKLNSQLKEPVMAGNDGKSAISKPDHKSPSVAEIRKPSSQQKPTTSHLVNSLSSSSAASKDSKTSSPQTSKPLVTSAILASKLPKPKALPLENEPFDSTKKGSYKCAHCRFLGTKVMEIRDHMIDRHNMNPLYSLDMAAEENNVPRFLMFCPKVDCKFCTKGKNLFLKHIDECALVETNCKKHTDDYKKRVQVTRNFAEKTLEKLQNLTK